MSSSPEDRIRLLTDQVIAAKTQREVDAILQELNAAIRDHVGYLRAIAVEMIPEAFQVGEQSGRLTIESASAYRFPSELLQPNRLHRRLHRS